MIKRISLLFIYISVAFLFLSSNVKAQLTTAPTSTVNELDNETTPIKNLREELLEVLREQVRILTQQLEELLARQQASTETDEDVRTRLESLEDERREREEEEKEEDDVLREIEIRREIRAIEDEIEELEKDIEELEADVKNLLNDIDDTEEDTDLSEESKQKIAERREFHRDVERLEERIKKIIEFIEFIENEYENYFTEFENIYKELTFEEYTLVRGRHYKNLDDETLLNFFNKIEEETTDLFKDLNDGKLRGKYLYSEIRSSDRFFKDFTISLEIELSVFDFSKKAYELKQLLGITEETFKELIEEYLAEERQDYEEYITEDLEKDKKEIEEELEDIFEEIESRTGELYRKELGIDLEEERTLKEWVDLLKEAYLNTKNDEKEERERSVNEERNNNEEAIKDTEDDIEELEDKIEELEERKERLEDSI